MKNIDTKSVIITGASSGIGEGLAWEFAKLGYNLGLAARNIDKLDKIKSKIHTQFPEILVETAKLDVMQYDSVEKVITSLDRRLSNSTEILIANSGIAGSKESGIGKFEDNRKVIETNLLGAIATIDAGLSFFKPRKKGTIVGISSVAGFRGLPGSAAYSSSKAGLSTYLESLRGEVRRYGIHVCCIHPGFIDTPIKNKKRAFEISVEKGSSLIASAILKKKKSSTIPWFPWAMVGFAMRNIPEWIWSRVSTK
ncbi:MAG: SDR family NAD(P)-dependent oxidoreductase [Leptospiraceae bacterium]|nr:SDR family NAD(P)-dependent oxidoreductase [Leptospiraceae bacterium]NUM41915.1 SDR family NAD(P)-dependent oxidoreductase [Leptospiraceae bacterium]